MQISIGHSLLVRVTLPYMASLVHTHCGSEIQLLGSVSAVFPLSHLVSLVVGMATNCGQRGCAKTFVIEYCGWR